MTPEDWDWKQKWDAVARGQDPMGQMGRVNWTLPHFLTLTAEVARQAALDRDDLVLDAGGGAGWVAAAFAPFVKQVVVVDYAPAMAARAHGMAQSGAFGPLQVVYDDVRTLGKLEGHSFDKVLCLGVLQYLDDKQQVAQALTRLRAATKPGGLALFGHNPEVERMEAWRAELSPSWSEDRKQMEAQRLWFARGELEALAAAAGFSGYERLPIHPMLPGAAFMSSFRVRVD